MIIVIFRYPSSHKQSEYCFQSCSRKLYSFLSIIQYKNVVLPHINISHIYTLFPKSWPQTTILLSFYWIPRPWNILSYYTHIVCSTEQAHWFLAVSMLTGTDIYLMEQPKFQRRALLLIAKDRFLWLKMTIKYYFMLRSNYNENDYKNSSNRKHQMS